MTGGGNNRSAFTSSGDPSGNNIFDKKDRISSVKADAENRQLQRQNELLEKIRRVEEVQKTRGEGLMHERFVKKEQQVLKEQAKEENVKRHQKRLEQKKELYLQRLKAEQQTFSETRKLKHEVIQERYYNHMIDEIKRHQMKNSLETMQITKKFDKSKIKSITQKFDFMTTVVSKNSVLSTPMHNGNRSIFKDMKARGASSQT